MLGDIKFVRDILPSSARFILRMLELRASGASASVDALQSHLSKMLKDDSSKRYEDLQILSTAMHKYSTTKESLAYVQKCVASVSFMSFHRHRV